MRKCASTKNCSPPRRAVFVFAAHIVESLQENARRYDGHASGGLLGGINTYGYVGGNPLSRIDPTGEFLQILVPVVVTVAAGTAGVIGGATVVGKINSANQWWVNQNLIPQIQMGQEAARKLCAQGDRSACSAATYFEQRENQCARELVGAGGDFSNVGNVPGTLGAGRDVLTNILRGR